MIHSTLERQWLAVLITMAAIMDLKDHRISNRLILAGLLSGFAYRIFYFGGIGAGIYLKHLFIPVILLFPLFLIHALGAGDIKLFSVIGVFVSLHFLFYCILFSFLAGAVFAVIKMLHNQNLFTRFVYFAEYIRQVIQQKRVLKYDHCSDGKDNLICFSIPILFSFLFCQGVGI